MQVIDEVWVEGKMGVGAFLHARGNWTGIGQGTDHTLMSDGLSEPREFIESRMAPDVVGSGPSRAFDRADSALPAFSVPCPSPSSSLVRLCG